MFSRSPKPLMREENKAGPPQSWAAKYLVFPKLLYFTLNVLVYSIYTFTAKYFSDVWRIPEHHFGYILGLCAVGFSGSILWTMIADRTKQHRLILLLTTLGYAGSFSLLRSGLFLQAPLRDRLIFVAICYGLANFFMSALFPLLDNRVLMILAAEPGSFSKELFGRQRLWGVLGQSVVTLLNGATIAVWGFDAMFVNLVASSLIFSLLIIFGVPSTTNLKKDENHPCEPIQPSIPFGEAARRLIYSPTYLFFLLIILVAGTTRGVAGNYLPQYLERVMNLSTLEISLILQSRIVAEVGIFFMGQPLMNWLGIHWLLAVAQLTGLLRVLIYAILPSHWTSIPLIVELLKGVNNACLVSAGVRYVHDLSPPGVEATAQGLFSGVHSYLANAASGFFGGAILHMCSSHAEPFKVLFAYTSILSTVGLVAFVAYYLIRRTKTVHR